MRTLALPLVLTLTACSTTELYEPRPTPTATAELVDAFCTAMRAMQAEEFAEQTMLPPGLEATPTLDTIELNQRLVDLIEQLRRLEAKIGGTAHVAAADASAAMAHDDHAEEQVAKLQRALSRLDQARTILTENVVHARTPGYLRRTWDEADDNLLRVHVPQLPGPLYVTDRNLDVAIDGDGYFGVRLADGSAAYTRCGKLQIDTAGRLADEEGNLVLPGTTIPADTLDLSIDPLGKVVGRTASNADVQTTFGEIYLYRFPYGTELRPLTTTLLLPRTAENDPTPTVPGSAGVGVLKQGFLQGSNVTLIHEINNLRTLAADRLQLRRSLAALGVFVD
ncbi:MAG: flagellar basal-body rod protein FlgG [Planctomycetota bacterium]